MKNGPARERQQHRNPSGYSRNQKAKRAYMYPEWVLKHRAPPVEVCRDIVKRFAWEGWRVPPVIMAGSRFQAETSA